MEAAMKAGCAYMGVKTNDICKASATGMVPSIFEYRIYCTTQEYYRCPLLLARSLRDGYRESIERAGAVLDR